MYAHEYLYVSPVITSISLTTLVRSIKTNFYYSMKNCEGDPEKLRAQLLNVIEHYQVSELLCPVIVQCFCMDHTTGLLRLPVHGAIYNIDASLLHEFQSSNM